MGKNNREKWYDFKHSFYWEFAQSEFTIIAEP